MDAMSEDCTNGSLSNSRRQRMEREVGRYLLEEEGERTLWVRPHTSRRFPAEKYPTAEGETP